jgi:hypothetical protein
MRNSGKLSGNIFKLAAAGRFSVRARHSAVAAVCMPLAWLALGLQSAYGQEAANTGGSELLGTVVETYCMECHNSEDWAGSLAMDLLDLGHPGGQPEVWEKAIGKLRGRLMPPAGAPQPSQQEVNAVVGFLETSVDAESKNRHVGHVPIQRLNRTEFTAFVKELLGVELDPGQILPTEIEVEGFNNIADALGVSPSFMEQYLSAARLAARRAVGEPVPKMAKVYHTTDSGSQDRSLFPLGTRGGVRFTHVFPADGEYRFNFTDEEDIDAGLYPRGMETAATLVILIDGVEVARREIGGPEYLELTDRDGPAGREEILAKVSSTAHVKAGHHEVIATYIERSWAASNNPAGNGRVSGMPIIRNGLEVEGPFSPTGLSMSESRAKIFVCQPTEAAEERACAERIAQNLATRAFRRPVTDADLDWLMPFYEAGRAEEGGFDTGVTELVTAILSSPDFLYRAIPTASEPGAARPLNDLELASRLSFFLWSQGPDEELITLAAEGRLSAPGVIDTQVARMLDDPRAQALIENFALAWLNLDDLEQVDPQDPGFNAAMRANFETEIRLFLSSVLLEERSVHDLLTADYTFLNEGLARQYGVPGVLGPQFRRVTLTDANRWGLLGKGAVLLRTSYGDRTSPVLRGAWVLDRIIGTPPTPPPPNVETDIAIRDGEAPTTVRARLEAHRDNPICQGCHGLIDPPGLALENFDVTGRWREVDALAKAPIDASTQLSSGLRINGPVELRHYLTSREDQFPTTVTRRLMMYALNREIEYFDMPLVRQIVREAAQNNYTFSSIIKGIVNSDAFRMQGPEEQENEAATAVASNQTTGPGAATAQ